MQTFLNHCAGFVREQYSHNTRHLCMVLPTKRSCKVLIDEFSGLKLDFDYEITDIEEFVKKTTGFECQSQVMLLLELFDIFKGLEPETKLEKFTGWGYILLKDFDLIDRNLVDASRLFRNLYDIKNLERWKLGEEKVSARIIEYFKLWENLDHTYEELRKRLLSQKQAYSGMMYRYLADNMESLLIRNPLYEKFAFIGFNALSKSEELIFKALTDKKRAEVIWDTDQYYMDEETENKAGFFLKRYKRLLSGTNWMFQSDHLLKSEKKIQVISVNNASMQGKVANQWLKNEGIVNKASMGEKQNTALVLADENLLIPVLYSLDEQFQGVHITIGLALKDSALFNLLDLLFEMNQTSIRDKQTKNYKFNHRSVIKILNHPFIRQYEKQVGNNQEKSLVYFFIYLINKNNLIFIGREEFNTLLEDGNLPEILKEDDISYFRQTLTLLTPLFDVLFVHWKNTLEVIRHFEMLEDILYNEENYFEAAYFREFDVILKKLSYFVSHLPKYIDIRTFKIFLYQAFRESKFEFDNENESNLYLMGIGETRNLDFETVVMLSVNETTLPRSKKQNSFIPVDICKAYDLPTYSEQDAVISYHFYRLMQRAKDIVLLYVQPSDTYGGKEKSRFILQLENDLRAKNKNVTFSEMQAKFRLLEEKPQPEMIFEKDEVIIHKIREYLQKGISPSAFNSFILCSMQFYLKYIARIESGSKVEEKMSADKLGSLVHEILEDIYKELIAHNAKVDTEAISSMLPSVNRRVEEKLQLEKFATYQITGHNYINKKAACELIANFLYAQMEECKNNGVPFEILNLENTEVNPDTLEVYKTALSTALELQIGEEMIPLTLKGITDRIDRVRDIVRIIDYKTGSVKKEDLKISKQELDRLVEDPNADKIRQLWLYKYILSKRLIESGVFQLGRHTLREDEPLTAGIYSLRNLEEGFLELINTDKDKSSLFPETLKEYVKLSEEYIAKIISRLLDKSLPFTKTPDPEACQFCSFINICGR